MSAYTIFRPTVCPPDCHVIDATYLGYDATETDLRRFWSAFETIYHARFLAEDLGITAEETESMAQAIDRWLWNDGSWSDRVDQVIGEDLGND